jgi:hypothetical protein
VSGAAQLSFDHVRVPREYMLMRFAKARPPRARPGRAWRRPASPWLSQGVQVLGGSFRVRHVFQRRVCEADTARALPSPLAGPLEQPS